MKRYAVITLGVLLTAVGDAMFLVPQHIISGGITSFALILQELFGLDVGIFVAVVRVALLIVCAIFLGKDYLAGSLFSVGVYLGIFSLLHQLATIFSLGFTGPLYLAVPLGAILVGSGYGVCISREATEVSFDALALIIHRRFKKIGVAAAMYGINFAVLLLGLYVFNWQVVLAGVVFSFIEAFSMHRVLLHLLQPQEG